MIQNVHPSTPECGWSPKTEAVSSAQVTRTTQRVTTSPSPYVQLCPQAGAIVSTGGCSWDFGDKPSELYVISRVLTNLLEKTLDGLR